MLHAFYIYSMVRHAESELHYEISQRYTPLRD
jgi:hypothetical protein